MKKTGRIKETPLYAALPLAVALFVTFLIDAYAAASTITGTVTLKSRNDAGKIVVFIERVDEEFFPPEEHPIMDQINLTFVPYVLPVLIGTTVDFHNSDDVLNNIFTPSWAGRKFNLGTYPKGVVRSYTFDRLGDVKLLCNIHPDMEGYILVLQNPYFATPDEDGRYRISNVPPGTYLLKVWYAGATGDPRQVTINGTQDAVVDFK